MLAIIVVAVLVLGTVTASAFRLDGSGVGRWYRARRFDAVYERSRQRAWQR
jgi:hypothetical protein